VNANSISRSTVRKPRPDFLLFPHATSRWAKKVRGKLHYFGKTDGDPKGEAAERIWDQQKDDLYAGRIPRGKREGLTVGELCDKFLKAKRAQLTIGKLTARSFVDYKDTTDLLIETFGVRRNFAAARSSTAATSCRPSATLAASRRQSMG